MRIAPFSICLLLLLVYIVSGAQPGQYRFSHMDISQGLSNNEVNCIFKDEKGFLWFGTRSGLDRYDGYKFKIFKHDLRDSTSINDEEIERIFEGPENKLWINTKSNPVIYNELTQKFDRHPQRFLISIGIPDAAIIDIKKDNEGNFWFLGAATGLYKYNPVTRKTLHLPDDSGNIAASKSAHITSMGINAVGVIWVVTSNGLLKEIDARTCKIKLTTGILQQYTSGELFDYQLYSDAQDGLWIYAPKVPAGVFYYDAAKEIVTHISKGNSEKNLNNDVIRSVTQDESGLIWLATDHGGINILDKKNFTLKYLLNHEDDNYSVAQNSISSMYADNRGIIWIGTFKKGISYYNRNIIKFPLYRHKLSDPGSLPYNDVNRFLEDEKGNLWIATNGGGLLYFNRLTGKFIKYMHDTANKNSLCNDVVVSLCLDHNNTLWIGTYFGGLDHFDGKTFTHYKHDNADDGSIADDAIWSIMEDSHHRMWFGTFSSGLDYRENGSDKFIHYKPTGYHSVHSAYISDLLQAGNGDIWIATSNGVDVIENKTGDFTQYYHHDDTKLSSSLSNDNTIALLEDSRGLIWIATREGLDFYDAISKTFKSLRKEDGLPDNIILSLVEDLQHNLWAGTPNGLSNIIVSKDKGGSLFFQFKNYNESDGLQGKEFNEYAAYATKEGEIIFGGANGFNLFTPKQVNSDVYDPDLVLTDLQMFNKTINPGEKLNGHIILPQSISDTREITLKYNENIFSIEFAALNFLHASRLRYAYTLEEFNNEWFIADEKTHKATYTNLNEGSYVFKVRTINEDGTWSKHEVLLKIHILPPLWRTNYAYATYVLLLLLGLYFSRKMIVRRARLRFALEQERKEAHRLHELDLMKISFFTNLSHEFRTPLSLILTPLDKIITEDPSHKSQLYIIQRNARRLLNLVNQLLDFRKMEMKELKLCPSGGDIIKFIKELSYSFNDVAAKKHITFNFNSTTDYFFTQFDHDKVERILFNLLSNAFKFTSGNGTISVGLDIRKGEAEEFIIEIRVTDTGIGIPTEKQEKIFERFFQNDIPENMVNQGSGIGLSITKEFVKLHNGTIKLESSLNKGSCFMILLPLKKQEEPVYEIADPVVDEIEIADPVVANFSINEQHEILSLTTTSIKVTKKPTILLVEDNDDLRSYLKDNLQQHFNIVEAADGKAGWQKALASHPDAIVSDISMPKMNGIDLCRKLKSDKRTSFIPVILLTAIIGEDQQLKGLATGASDYVTKPFNFEILYSKIKNLLAQQETARRTYQKLVNADPTEIHVDSPDEKFMHHALEIIEKNMDNADFSVEELSTELFMSRVGLYKKMLALSGKTPLEFIRSVRLQRAAQLLEKSHLTVAEVAYEVGFNDPKYFSKFFKKHFNTLPSTYQLMKKKEDSNSVITNGTKEI